MSDEKETRKEEEQTETKEETNYAQSPKEMYEFPIRFRDKDFKFTWQKGAIWAEIKYVATELLYSIMTAEKEEIAELIKVETKVEKEKETKPQEAPVEN